MPARPILPDDRRTSDANARIAAFHADSLSEVKAAVDSGGVVVVGMAQNPHPRRARTALKKAGIEFTYLEYGSYLGEWNKRLAIKLWSGWPTFPQVFVGGVLLGGANELEAALADGSLRERLKRLS